MGFPIIPKPINPILNILCPPYLSFNVYNYIFLSSKRWIFPTIKT